MGTIVDLKAFYNQPDYEQKSREELKACYPPQTPVFIYESGNKWVRLSKDVVFHGSSLILVYTIATFCLKKISKNYLAPPAFPKIVVWITIPLTLYNIAYIIAGWGVHPPSFPSPVSASLDTSREAFFSTERVVKRVSIQANGRLIDTMIFAKKDTLENHRRWIIFSNGNCGRYEYRSGKRYGAMDEQHKNHEYFDLADKLHANIIFYNYPSTGRSSGWFPNHNAVLASHRAMHSLVKQLGAAEVVDFGLSLGGGIQGESLKDFPFEENIKYVFVKRMTFATLSELVKTMFHPIGLIGGFALPLLNWDYSGAQSSRTLPHPEIIIQHGESYGVYDINNLPLSDQVGHDGLIPASQSYAKVILDDPNCRKDKKIFAFEAGPHGSYMYNHKKIATLINEQF